jgi:prepilin-type N-terminal cleavage/methylation domain-containing protein
MFQFFNSIKEKKNRSGFSIPELMITISIIVILSTVVVMSSRRAETELQFGNFSHEFAFLFRKAQSAATNVAIGQTGSGRIASTFGIHVPRSKNQIIYYQEFENDPVGGRYRYNSGEDSTLPGLSIPSYMTIASVCVRGDTSRIACSFPNPQRFDLDITFTRPTQQPQIIMRGCNTITNPNIVQIGLSHNRIAGVRRYIILHKAGMIYTSQVSELAEQDDGC